MKNREDILANAKDIEERRARIEANRSTIVENGAKASELLKSGERRMEW